MGLTDGLLLTVLLLSVLLGVDPYYQDFHHHLNQGLMDLFHQLPHLH